MHDCLRLRTSDFRPSAPQNPILRPCQPPDRIRRLGWSACHLFSLKRSPAQPGRGSSSAAVCVGACYEASGIPASRECLSGSSSSQCPFIHAPRLPAAVCVQASHVCARLGFRLTRFHNALTASVTRVMLASRHPASAALAAVQSLCHGRPDAARTLDSVSAVPASRSRFGT